MNTGLRGPIREIVLISLVLALLSTIFLPVVLKADEVTFTDPFAKDTNKEVVVVPEKSVQVVKLNTSEAETLKDVEVYNVYFDSFHQVLYLSVRKIYRAGRKVSPLIFTFVVVDGKLSIGALYTILHNGTFEKRTEIWIGLPKIPGCWRNTLKITADQVHLQ